MHYQRTPDADDSASSAQSKFIRKTTSLTNCLLAFAFLLAMLIVPPAMAQSFIRFTLTQGRITVPANNAADSVTITNIAINLGNGATNANFDVSGLPAGAGYSLTYTDGTPAISITTDTNIVLTVNTTNLAEGLYPFNLNAGGLDTNGLPATNSFPFILQAAHIWNGTLNVSNAWSDAGSWSNGLPSATSDVVFADAGAQTNGFTDPSQSGIPFTNSFVTADTVIGSLRFSQTGFTNTALAANPPPIYNHIQIAAGKTLTVAGTNGFSLLPDYFDEANAGLRSMNITIDGAGGKLVVSNMNASFSVLEGASLIPTLNMSNLDTFIAKVGRIGIADYQVYPEYRDLNTALNAGRDTNTYSGRPRQLSVNFFAAKTNIFLSGFIDPSNYTNEITRGYGFTVNNNEQQGVGSSQSQLFILGISNLFNADGVCFYGASGNGTTRFAATNGSAVFRNTNGTSRMSVFTVSDDGGTNAALSNIKGIVDFSLGSVNALVDRLYMSRDREQIATNQTPNIQSDLIVGKGTFDVNTAILGFQEHTKPDWTVLGGGQPYLNYCQGRLQVTNGGTFRVNGTMTLGYTADTNNFADAEQYNTYGRITIYSNSIVSASNIVVDTGLNFYDSNGRQNQIIINAGGNLVISNSIGGPDYTGAQYPTFGDNGGPGLPLDNLTMQSGSTLTLFVTGGKTNVYVRTLSSSAGAPGIIKIASLPSFPVYPTNISLIAYTTANPVLAADMSAVGGNVQGYILNNVANHTIDLFLTTNAPRSLVWTGSVNNQWDLETPNWVPVGGGAATAYSMGDIAIFNDSTSVTNIDIVETVVPNQQTNGVIINNSANVFTFNSVGGSIAGTAKMVKQGTNDLDFNAIESGPVTISAGNVNVTGSMGSMTLASNTVLNVMSGGSVAGVTATTANVNVQGGGTIGGAVSLNNSLLLNDGLLNIPSGTLALAVTNNSIVTNNADGTISIAGTSNPAAEIYPGSVMANLGSIYVVGARMTVDGLYFGTGQFTDTANPFTSSSLGRLQMSNTPGALLSPGAEPTNSIGNFFAGVRLDLSGNNPQNTAPTLLIDVDAANNQYDTITCERWNNIGCIWKMNLLNGTFQSGQVFRILVNPNGLSLSNVVDTAAIFPLMQPTVPGPGLQWNLTGVQPFGTVSVTNSSMIWDGSGNGSWDTNGTAGNWKSTVYSDNQGAIFDDTASGSTTITLNSPVAPAGFNIVTVTNINPGVSTNVVITTNTPSFSPGIVVSNALKDYTITTSAQTNRITGMTSIYKTGPGMLTLLASNDFTGGMIVEGGTVAFTNVTALGAGSGTRAVYDQIILNSSSLKYYASNTNQNLGHALTLNGTGGTLEVSSNGTLLGLNSMVSGPGTLTKVGEGSLILSTSGDNYSGGTVISEGTLRLTAAAAGSGTVSLSDNTTLELTNAFTLTNTVNVAGTTEAVSLQGISTNVLTGPLTGSAATTITSTNANRLLVFNNDLTGYSGVISFGTSIGQFRFNNRTNDSPTTGSAAATFDLGTGSATLFNVSGTNQTYNLGALSGGANTTLSGSATNGGAAATTYSIGANGANTTFAGKIVNGQDVVSVNKVGTGSLALNGVNTYTGATTVSGGTLAGNGSIAGPLTVQAGGTLAPGAPLGTFTVSNNATLGGQVLMELSQGGTPQNSALAVTGTITATGSLVVTNVGPDINNGTKFVLFNKAVTGFTSITLPASNPANTSAYTWQTNIAVDGSITLLSGGGSGSPVNTNPTNITFSVSGNTMSLTWPGDHLGWQLLSNSVGLTATNQWYPITGSTSTTQENLTFDPSMTNVFFRMIYPPQP